MTSHYVIYDSNCNLCVTFVGLLQKIDNDHQFDYIPMQSETFLATLGITAADCEKGMILIKRDPQSPPEFPQECQQWQGSDAAEEIGRLLPWGKPLIEAYRALPAVKAMGDRIYEQVRDHRYEWFGRRDRTHIPKSICLDQCSSNFLGTVKAEQQQQP